MSDAPSGPRGRLTGQTLAGRYEVLECIGRGGMGEVYRARHLLIDKPVAIKVLHQERAANKRAMERFQQEARAAARVGNVHIVDVTDYGFTEEGEAFLVMEVLEGESLQKTLEREGALPVARVVAITRQILGALGAAHEAGIVHRDLKSDNVFLQPAEEDSEDLVKLLDFGISKALLPGTCPEGDPGLTDTGEMVGTPHYLAPEQAEESRLVDHRADLYSLGVLLYQMLTGELPFPGSNIWNVLMRHAKEPPVPPGQRRAGGAIPPDLEDLVLRAMSKDPADRPGSAREMLAELERVPVRAAGASGEPEPRRGHGGLVLALGVLAAAGLAAVGLVVLSPRPEPAAEIVTSDAGTPTDLPRPAPAAPPDLQPGDQSATDSDPSARPNPKQAKKPRRPPPPEAGRKKEKSQPQPLRRTDLPPNPYKVAP